MHNEKCCAYVAVRTEPKMTKDVCKKMADTRFVKQSHAVAGQFDMICFVEADTHDELYNTVLNTIRSYPGVTHTETWPAMNW